MRLKKYLLIFALFIFSCGYKFDDDNLLNPKLEGIWIRDIDAANINQYIITGTETPIISHSSGSLTYESAAVDFVYNFSERAGCLIVQRSPNQYTAVYYKDLRGTSVIMDEAYDKQCGTYASASSLESATEKFAPEFRTLYGGDLLDSLPLEKRKTEDLSFYIE